MIIRIDLFLIAIGITLIVIAIIESYDEIIDRKKKILPDKLPPQYLDTIEEIGRAHV